MKITAKQYAQVLFDLLKEKRDEDVKSVLLEFVRLLKKNNQLSLFAKIIENFVKIWNKEKGIVEVEVISKNKLNFENIEEIKKFVSEYWRKKSGYDKNKNITVNLKNKINKNIIGGIILKIDGESFDASVRGILRELKKQLKNN